MVPRLEIMISQYYCWIISVAADILIIDCQNYKQLIQLYEIQVVSLGRSGDTIYDNVIENNIQDMVSINIHVTFFFCVYTVTALVILLFTCINMFFVLNKRSLMFTTFIKEQENINSEDENQEESYDFRKKQCVKFREYFLDEFEETNVFDKYAKTYRLNKHSNGDRREDEPKEEITKIEKTDIGKKLVAVS